jgi:hypothetical protein
VAQQNDGDVFNDDYSHRLDYLLSATFNVLRTNSQRSLPDMGEIFLFTSTSLMTWVETFLLQMCSKSRLVYVKLLPPRASYSQGKLLFLYYCSDRFSVLFQVRVCAMKGAAVFAGAAV